MVILFANCHLAVFTEVVNVTVDDNVVGCDRVVDDVVGVAVDFNKDLVADKLTVGTVGVVALGADRHFTVFTEIVDAAVDNNDLVIYDNIVDDAVNVAVDGNEQFVCDHLTVFTVGVAVFFACDHLTVGTEIVNCAVDDELVIYDDIVDDVVNVAAYGQEDFICHQLTVCAVGVVTLFTDNHLTVGTEIVDCTVDDELVVNDHVVDDVVNVAKNGHENVGTDELTVFTVGVAVFFAGRHLAVCAEVVNCAVDDELVIDDDVVDDVVNVAAYGQEDFVCNELTVFAIGEFALNTRKHLAVFAKVVNVAVNDELVVDDDVVDDVVNVAKDGHEFFVCNKFTVCAVGVAVFFANCHLTVGAEVVDRAVDNVLVVNDDVVDNVVNVTCHGHEQIRADKLTVFTVGVFTLFADNHLTVGAEIVDRAVDDELIEDDDIVDEIVDIAIYGHEFFVCHELTVFTVGQAVFFALEHLTVGAEIIDTVACNDLVVNDHVVDHVVNVVSNGNEELATYKLTVFTVGETVACADSHFTFGAEVVNCAIKHKAVVDNHVVDYVVGVFLVFQEFFIIRKTLALCIVCKNLTVSDDAAFVGIIATCVGVCRGGVGHHVYTAAGCENRNEHESKNEN